MEVIYTGLRQTPQQIVASSVQEDVDVIGLSILSGAHMTLVPEILRLLKENDAADIPLVVGGIIPEADIRTLKTAGVRAIFTPGASTDEIVKLVRGLATEQSS